MLNHLKDRPTGYIRTKLDLTQHTLDKGQAAVDESSLFGKFVPVEKTVCSKVYSGTVNQNGCLEVETTSDSTSSTITKIAQLIEEAQTNSARTELAINRFVTSCGHCCGSGGYYSGYTL